MAPHIHAQQLRISNQLGVAAIGERPTGNLVASFGVMGLVNWKCFVGGIGVEAQTAIVSSALQGHALAGFTWHPLDRLQIDLLGMAGPRHYTGWGGSLLGDDPGASATLTAVGARSLITYTLVKWQTRRLLVGGWFGYQDDLGRKTVTYSYTDETSGWFGEEPTYDLVTESQTLGAPMQFAALTFGAEFNL